MGLDVNGVRFLLYCRKRKVDFTRTAMIGRQALHFTRRGLEDVFKSFRAPVDSSQLDAMYDKSEGYAEPLLRHLGGREVHSFDHSEYEGASHLHDMNREVPEHFKGRYTTVLDGGSLEHVFNFPVAIKNCMEMLAVGGHYLAITPANNFLGHGFYQFSPELFFSVFTRENGFEMQEMIALEDRPNAQWYAVKSPMEVRGRVTLVNKAPVHLLVIARKVAARQIFETTPQQSDYVSKWSEGDKKADGAPGAKPLLSSLAARSPRFLRRGVPASLKRAILGGPKPPRSGFDPRFFRVLDPTAGKEL
jgi:hypothetical protein